MILIMLIMCLAKCGQIWSVHNSLLVVDSRGHHALEQSRLAHESVLKYSVHVSQ